MMRVLGPGLCDVGRGVVDGVPSGRPAVRVDESVSADGRQQRSAPPQPAGGAVGNAAAIRQDARSSDVCRRTAVSPTSTLHRTAGLCCYP